MLRRGEGWEEGGVWDWVWGRGLGKVRSDREHLQQRRCRRGCCAPPGGGAGDVCARAGGIDQRYLCAFLRAGMGRGSHAGMVVGGWLAAQSRACRRGGREHLTKLRLIH